MPARTWWVGSTIALLLTGCVTSGSPLPPGRYLSDSECRDLTALKSNTSPTFGENQSELSALRKAGYDPSPWYDPYYPEDLQVAQQRVDYWYQTECRAAPAQ
jgi:hypothetical protein